MTLSFEALLFLGVAGFYLFDSAMLLYFNELVFVEAYGKWTFSCPRSDWRLAGRSPYLPNPFTPDRPVFRVTWNVSAPPGVQENDDDLRNFILALAPLRVMTAVLFGLLLIALPAVLFTYGSGPILLALLAAVYLAIIVMLVLVYRHLAALRLSREAFIKLAFDVLACAPFAVNLVRKIAVHRSLAGDPIEFASKTFDAATFDRLVAALCSRVDEELNSEIDEASCRALEAYRSRVVGMVR